MNYLIGYDILVGVKLLEHEVFMTSGIMADGMFICQHKARCRGAQPFMNNC